MLSIYPTVQKSQPGSACVAPRDVFADYDSVMARLTNNWKPHNHSFRLDMETSHLSTQPEINPHNIKNTISTDKDRDCELRERPNTHTQQAAVDISNKYSGRITRNVATERRAARKSQPYQDRRRRQRAAASSEETNSSNRCTYERRARKSQPHLEDRRQPAAASSETNSSNRRSRARKSQPHQEDRRQPSAASSEGANSSARCWYISEDGERCDKVLSTPQLASRHWLSCHLYKEAKQMLENKIAIGEGTLIASMAHLEKVKARITCPNGCGTIVTRSDAIERHRGNCNGAS